MNETTTVKMNGGVWKYIALCSLSALGAMLTGEFNPNRQLVTTEQMTSALLPLQTSLAVQTAEIDSLRDNVNDLKGQLKAQKLLTDR